ncbi:putative head-tail joining protein (plasmid) [Clostridium botulinum V891]|nr:putative head-tail joining protein [Clostridium botulinum V891]
MADMELEGMDSLIRKLEDMGKAGTRVENKALKKAGQIIVDEAKNNVAVRTGKLKEGLKVSGVRKKVGINLFWLEYKEGIIVRFSTVNF